MYQMVSRLDPPTTEVVYVLAAVGFAAYLLSRWAYLLLRGPKQGALGSGLNTVRLTAPSREGS